MKTSFKLILALLFAILFGVCLPAQTRQLNENERYVMGIAGRSDTAKSDATQTPKYLVDWTIGEPVVESFRGAKKQLTQGFHQSLLNQKSTYVFSRLDQDHTRHFSVFPNPFVSNFTVKWDFSENLNLEFELFALDGRRLFYQRQNAANGQLFIQLQNLTPSTYILRISDPQRNFVETHTLIKI
ncbi:MAG: T9SS type A sorting domain-containing protein [Bacteroidales bacterium]|nr:T9SS type A sorting domain-containing protein [Bacteroidales bacterium]